MCWLLVPSVVLALGSVRQMLLGGLENQDFLHGRLRKPFGRNASCSYEYWDKPPISLVQTMCIGTAEVPCRAINISYSHPWSYL